MRRFHRLDLKLVLYPRSVCLAGPTQDPSTRRHPERAWRRAGSSLGRSRLEVLRTLERQPRHLARDAILHRRCAARPRRPNGRVVQCGTPLMMRAASPRHQRDRADCAVRVRCHVMPPKLSSVSCLNVRPGMRRGSKRQPHAADRAAAELPSRCLLRASAPASVWRAQAIGIIERGKPFCVAVGVWGGLTCRAAGMIAYESELPADAAIPRPSRRAILRVRGRWYETVGIGVSGGEIDALVKRHSAIRSRRNPQSRVTSSIWTSGEFRRSTPAVKER